MKNTLTHYMARWQRAGQPTLGSVSFSARSDTEAKRKADRLASEIGLPNTPRTIYSGARCVDCIQTGKR